MTDDTHIDFYEREFYPFSNFSAFKIKMNDIDFMTAEHAYHWCKFDSIIHRNNIINARSAHMAYRYALENKQYQNPKWDSIKVSIMENIIRMKINQHEYVRRKLLESGDRELIECSWRDDFWGWGLNRNGKNMLGKLWMKLRTEMIDNLNKKINSNELIYSEKTVENYKNKIIDSIPHEINCSQPVWDSLYGENYTDKCSCLRSVAITKLGCGMWS